MKRKLISRTNNTLKVYSVVLIESFVLGCNKGKGQIFIDLIPFDLYTVRILADILVDLITGCIVDDGSLTGRYDVADMDLGSVGNNTFKKSDPTGDTAGDRKSSRSDGELEQK